MHAFHLSVKRDTLPGRLISLDLGKLIVARLVRKCRVIYEE
jgi:hypothetical protein